MAELTMFRSEVNSAMRAPHTWSDARAASHCRYLRDALSARLMMADERIHSIDAGMLMIAKEL